MERNAYTLLSMWAEDGKMALAYPCVIDGQQTVICTAIDLEADSKAIANFPDEEIRAMFAVYVMRELKRRAQRKAHSNGVEVEL